MKKEQEDDYEIHKTGDKRLLSKATLGLEYN